MKTIRVFISSTFRDMHAERDYLVKFVFPELRELCAKRRLHFIDLDLRWGVTEEESEQGKVLEIIIDEIELSRPFFIAVLSERYGTIPDRVTEDVKLAHPWVQGYTAHSITALEIVHAVLRNPELAKRSFFYFRDPQFISQVPESMKPDFVAENQEAAQKLAAFKDQIRASGRPVLENYPCRWDNEKKQIVDLEIFGQHVLNDLWAAICDEYPEESLESDPLAIERDMHEAFTEERSYLHIGRTEQARLLTDYVHSSDHKPVVITGESGCGKSAFLSSWYRSFSADNPDDFVLAYFIGASPDSTDHLRLLRNMCTELKREFNLEVEIPEYDERLSETLGTLLTAASGRDNTVSSPEGQWPRQQNRNGAIILLLVAIDQLSPLEDAQGLGWLLDYIPDGARLVVSTPGGDCLDVLRRREAREIEIPPLTVDEQRQIVLTVLSEWRRKLNEQQMTALLSHPGTSNPLYLRVALEELRLFGKFEELTARIKTIADDIPGLFDQMFERLEEDHGRRLVTEVFTLLGCSRHGLSEAELLDLLAIEAGDKFPRAPWVKLARSIKPYLFRRGELLGFFHRQLVDAVIARYLNRYNRYAKLATYFENALVERKLEEYPYQLQQSQQWQALATALSELDFFDYALTHNRKYEWMEYWRSLEGHYEPESCYYAAIESREKVEGETYNIGGLLDEIGSFLKDMGLYSSALVFCTRGLSICEKVLGPDHMHVARSLNNIAVLYYSQDDYDKALPLYQRAMAIHEKVMGPNHPDVAVGLNNLAGLYNSQGKYDEALPLLQRALAIHEGALEPNHPHIALSLNSLAWLYQKLGKYNEAMPLYQRALAIRERNLGPNHPHVALSISNLAGLYKELGKHNEALPLYQRALTIRERTLGSNHPDVAVSLNNLANNYESLGKYDESLPIYQRALAICERTIGIDHPEAGRILNNLACIYKNQCKYDEALPLLQRALAIRERALGPNHLDVAQSLSNLATVYESQGKYDEALPLLQRSLAIFQATLGPNHLNFTLTLNNLACLYNSQRKYDEALSLYQHALATCERIFGTDHPEVAKILNNLAMVYDNQGKYNQALPIYQRASSIALSTLGLGHPITKQILDNLAGCEADIR